MKKKEKLPEKKYKIADLIKIENKKRFSSFGKMILSTKKTSRSSAFGFGNKNSLGKFLKKKSKVKYMKTEIPFYKKTKRLNSKNCKFSKKERFSKEKIKYDYYNIKDKSDITKLKKKKKLGIKFLKEKIKMKNFDNPGFAYNSLNINLKKPRIFSIGRKLKKKENKENFRNIGPNTYFPNYNILSTYKKIPNFLLKKKLVKKKKSNFNNITYEDYSSVGKQVFTKRYNCKGAVFGKFVRDDGGKFVNFEKKGLRLFLPHAKI